MKFTPLVLLLVVIALAGNGLTVAVLLGVRSAAAGRLQEVAASLRGMAGESIETTIALRQTMQLDAEIRITKPTQIDLALVVTDQVPVRLDVKVNQTLKVPLDLPIDQQILLETAVSIPKTSKIRVKADIGFDQPMRWRVVNPIAPSFNIEGQVPVDQNVEISFPDTLPIKGTVPIKFRLQEEVLVPVAFELPIDQMVDLKLAIQQQARVGFPEPLHLVGQIPIIMEIPVQIPLQTTPVGAYLEKMAGQLERLLDW